MSSIYLGDPHTAAAEAAESLRSTVAVRQRAGQLLARARNGQSTWFAVDDARLEATANEVVSATRQRYPKLDVPLHSRWRHFEAGGINRKAQLDQLLASLTARGRADSMVDMTVVSVLLDAGAGPDWKYVEPATGRTFTRSEGLAVASFHAFAAGLFSSDSSRPLQADAQGLRALVSDHLASALQVSDANPLVGFQDRVILLRRLGEVMQEQQEVFGDPARPAGLFDTVVAPSGPNVPLTAQIPVHDILSQILGTLSGIWPTSNAIADVPLGDCWRHPAVRGDGLTDGWVPLHKLSQWLTYSLVEPFEWAGARVTGMDQLTALPEYRNGGLLLDTGLLRLRDAAAAQQLWQPGDEIIVEWRALTVALMDEVALAVRRQLRMDANRFPLACVLEGGSWSAGRELAQRQRGGLPPLRVATDGTLF